VANRRFTATASALIATGSLLAASPVPATADSTPQGVGPAPTFQQQSAGWTRQQADRYQAKLRMARHRPSLANSPTNAPATKYLGFQLIHENPNFYCGPATNQMILSQFGVYIDQSQLGQEMGTNNNTGTYRSAMSNNLNAHESRNTYVWQNLTYDPPGFNQGTADLQYYTQLDIRSNFPLAYNVLTYSPPPPNTPMGEGGHGGPLWHFGNARFWHYFAGSGYDRSTIRVSDPWWPAQDNYSTQNLMLAIDNHAATDQILW
jgi:hypothetical protein